LRNSLLLETPYMSIPSTGVFPREVLVREGGFDERLSTSADTDLACRVALRHAIACVYEPLVQYRLHEDQMHHGVQTMERDMRLVFDKIFHDPDLPPEIGGLRRRAYANLYATIAGHHIKEGSLLRAVAPFARACTYDPKRVAALAFRRFKRRTATRGS
jgi:hypothetical protein